MAQSRYQESTRDTLGNVKDRVSEQMSDVADAAQKQAQNVGENVKSVAVNLESAMRHSIRTQPMTTLALVAAAGFVLGAIWKS